MTEKDHPVKPDDIVRAFWDEGLDVGDNRTVNSLVWNVADVYNFDAEDEAFFLKHYFKNGKPAIFLKHH